MFLSLSFGEFFKGSVVIGEVEKRRILEEANKDLCGAGPLRKQKGQPGRQLRMCLQWKAGHRKRRSISLDCRQTAEVESTTQVFLYCHIYRSGFSSLGIELWINFCHVSLGVHWLDCVNDSFSIFFLINKDAQPCVYSS